MHVLDCNEVFWPTSPTCTVFLYVAAWSWSTPPTMAPPGIASTAHVCPASVTDNTSPPILSSRRTSSIGKLIHILIRRIKLCSMLRQMRKSMLQQNVAFVPSQWYINNSSYWPKWVVSYYANSRLLSDQGHLNVPTVRLSILHFQPPQRLSSYCKFIESGLNPH